MQEIIVDSFAGGGGASHGIAMALGRGPDVAINHDAAAIAMHAENHPDTEHFTEDVWKLVPFKVTQGRPVGLLWSSPDCCHFSRAKGAKPVKKEIRSLAWVVIKWAAEVRPRVIILENVREFESWGPLVQKVVAGIGQVLDDGSPVLVPDPNRKGHSFNRWAGRLRGLGYQVSWRVLNAADYGAPTHRRRLFLIARCDGRQIVWPEPTHGDPKKLDDTPLLARMKPWRTAAECIDWSIPCPSIFERKRPLAENTMRRIAMGIKRYVLENPKPFIVQVNHGGPEFRGQDLDEPLSTVTGKHGYGIVVPHVTEFRGNSVGSGIDEPLPTVTSGAGAARPAGAAHAMGIVIAQLAHGKGPEGGTFNDGRVTSPDCPLGTVHAGGNNHALVSAFLAKHFGGPRQTSGQRADCPLGTATTVDHHAVVEASLSPCIMTNTTGHPGAPATSPLPTQTTGNQQYLAAANLVRFNHDDAGVDVEKPLPTITQTNHAALVYSFLVRYFGNSIGQHCTEPLFTITGKDRFGLVTVTVGGELYVIVDIGMRMLTPRELARAQGLPESYILTGSKSNQVARIGNSVCPVMAKVLVAANYQVEEARKGKVS